MYHAWCQKWNVFLDYNAILFKMYWQWWKHIYIYCYIYYITLSGIAVLVNECVFSHHKCKHKWNGMLASSISKHTKAYFLLRSLVKRYCIRTNDLFPFIYKHKRIYITNVNVYWTSKPSSYMLLIYFI